MSNRTAIGGAPKHAQDDYEHAAGDGHEDAMPLELSAQALKKNALTANHANEGSGRKFWRQC